MSTCTQCQGHCVVSDALGSYTCDHCGGSGYEPARQAGRAASANETGAEGAVRAYGVFRTRFDENEGKEFFYHANWHNDYIPQEGERIVEGWFVPAMAAEAEKPFGWAQPKGGNYFTRNESSAKRIGGLVPVYTAPQPAQADARVGLTDEQREAIQRAIDYADMSDRDSDAEALRALLATPLPEPRAEDEGSQ